MSLLERYRNGETQLVYDKIADLGNKAFTNEHYSDVEQVIIETFNRVGFNLEVIYAELRAIGYVFWKDDDGNDEVFSRPSNNVDVLLKNLEELISPFGYLPLSLKLYYKIVGSCNLAWNYQENPDIYWEMADPLQIAPLQHVLEELSDPDWLEMAREIIEEGYLPLIEMAADMLHKDNISGGPPYGIEIQHDPCVDSRFVDGIMDANFIDYLRTCFEYSGFPGFANSEHPESFVKFQQKIKPLLKPI